MSTGSAAAAMPKNNEEIRNQYFENKRKEFEDGCYQHQQPDACFCLAEWHQVVAKDVKTSSEMYAQNCLGPLNHHGSCYNLAIQLLQQKPTTAASTPSPITHKLLQDKFPNDASPLTMARSLLKDACEKGKHPVACLSYASMLLSGAGEGGVDVPAAERLLRSNCYEQHDGRACVKLGTVYLRGEPAYPGVPKDAKKAFDVMKHACDELGHPNGCQVLAVMYKYGDGGVQVDMDKSLHYQKLTKELSQKTGEKLGSLAVSVDGGGGS